eukprot:3513955-Ditylum_brightwellii.AAC.1
MAMLFLQNADKACYGKKYDEIDEAMMKGYQGGGCANGMGCDGQGGRVSDGNTETYTNGGPQICPPDEEP